MRVTWENHSKNAGWIAAEKKTVCRRVEERCTSDDRLSRTPKGATAGCRLTCNAIANAVSSKKQCKPREIWPAIMHVSCQK